jgi:hypothetical protein
MKMFRRGMWRKAPLLRGCFVNADGCVAMDGQRLQIEQCKEFNSDVSRWNVPYCRSSGGYTSSNSEQANDNSSKFWGLAALFIPTTSGDALVDSRLALKQHTIPVDTGSNESIVVSTRSYFE